MSACSAGARGDPGWVCAPCALAGVLAWGQARREGGDLHMGRVLLLAFLALVPSIVLAQDVGNNGFGTAG